MTNYYYSAWLWTIAIGMPLWTVVMIVFWRHTRTSDLFRFVACFFLAAIVVPITTNNGHSAAYAFSIFNLLISAGNAMEFLWALKIAGIFILPIALVMFLFWSWILYMKNRPKNKQSPYDL